MIDIEIDKGLAFTSIKIIHNSNEIILEKILIDTGSANTVLSADKLLEIGIAYEPEDIIHRVQGIGGSEFVFEKKIDAISIADIQVKDFNIEIGAMDYGIEMKGILGMDLFIAIGAIIDLSNFTLYNRKT